MDWANPKANRLPLLGTLLVKGYCIQSPLLIDFEFSPLGFYNPDRGENIVKRTGCGFFDPRRNLRLSGWDSSAEHSSHSQVGWPLSLRRHRCQAGHWSWQTSGRKNKIKVLLVLQSGLHPCFDIWLPLQLILYIILSMSMKLYVYGRKNWIKIKLQNSLQFLHTFISSEILSMQSMKPLIHQYK